MYNVQVLTTFEASHAVTIAGIPEEPHQHNWKVRASLQGERLDSDGLLIDFIRIEKYLNEITRPFEGADLNNCNALEGKNPSAEIIARYIFDELEKKVQEKVQVTSITITEAPNCEATYTP